MKKLLILLKDYKKETVLGPLFKLLEASFELIVPLVIAAIIDTGVVSRDTNYILKMCLILVILALIGFVCAITAQYFAAKAAVGMASKLRHTLFAHIEKLSYTELDTIGTSTLINGIHAVFPIKCFLFSSLGLTNTLTIAGNNSGRVVAISNSSPSIVLNVK